MSVYNNILKKKNIYYPLFLLISGLFVFLKTTSPDVTTGDSGELLSAAYFLGINHPPGYPLYLILAKLFSYLAYLFYPLFLLAGINPLKIHDSFAFHVNFMSGVLTTCSTIIFYYITILIIKSIYNRQKTISTSESNVIDSEKKPEISNYKFLNIINKFYHEIALILSFCLGTINLIWSQSTNSEIYTLNLFLISLSFYALIQFSLNKKNNYLLLFSFIYGLSIVSHQTNLVFAPVFSIWILWNKRKVLFNQKLILKMFLLFILGLSIYFYMPIRSLSKPPLNWGNTGKMKNFVSHVLRRQYGQLVTKPKVKTVLHAKRSNKMFIKQNFELMKILYKNLTLPLSILIVLGLFELISAKRSLFVFLITSILLYSITIVYIANFKIAKLSIYVNEIFFIPLIFLFMIFSSIGIIFILKHFSLHFIKFIPILPLIIIGMNYHINNEHNNYIIAEYTKNILNTVEKNARLFVMGDNTTFPLAYYHYVRKIRPDILIIGEYGFVFQDVFKLYNIKQFQEKFRKKLRDKIEQNILKKSTFPIYYTYAATPKLPEGKSLRNYGLIYKVITDEAEQKMDYYDLFSYHFKSMDDKSIYKDLMDKDMASIIYLNLGEYLNKLGETVLASLYLSKSKFVTGSEYAKKKIHFNLALDHKKEGNYQKAIEELLMALSVDREYSRAHSLLGNIYSDIGKPNAAVKEYILSLNNDPDNTKTWNNLGVEYNKINDKKRAFDSFQKAIQKDPNNYEAYNNLAVILEDFRKFNEAISLYKKAIKLNPKYKDAYYNLGTLFLNSNHLKKADQFLKKAIKVYPEYPDAYYNLGILFQKKKDYRNSIVYFLKAARYRQNFESAIFNIGVSYLWLKEYKEAEKYFKKTIKINPSSAKSYKHLGNTYYYINDLKKAYKEWKKAYKLNPKDTELENNLKVLDSKQ